MYEGSGDASNYRCSRGGEHAARRVFVAFPTCRRDTTCCKLRHLHNVVERKKAESDAFKVYVKHVEKYADVVSGALASVEDNGYW